MSSTSRVSRKFNLSRVDLEQSRILRLLVVLLGCVFPRDSEHGFGLVLPAQALISAALYLRDQPLFQVQLCPFIHLQHMLHGNHSHMSHVHSRSENTIKTQTKKAAPITVLLPQVLTSKWSTLADQIDRFRIDWSNCKLECRSHG